MVSGFGSQLEGLSHTVVLNCKHLADERETGTLRCSICKKEEKLLERPMLQYVYQECLANLDRMTYVWEVIEVQRELWEDLPQVAEIFNRILKEKNVDQKEPDLTDLRSPTGIKLPVSPPARPSNPHARFLEEDDMKGNRCLSDQDWVVLSFPRRLSHRPDRPDIKDDEEDPVVTVARYLSSQGQ